MWNVEENYEEILFSVMRSTGLSRDDADKFYFEMWIVTHGVATLIATSMLGFTADEINMILTDTFRGLLKQYNKSENKGDK